MRLPRPQQWSLDAIKQIAATPWAGHQPSTSEVIHFQPGEGPTPIERESQVRRLYIKQSDLDEFGYIQNCKRCQSIITYGSGKSYVPHSNECRTRIVKDLEKTAHGQLCLAKLQERENRFLLENV